MNQERKYWNEHYLVGGTSGAGSVGGYRKWKWNVIGQYVNIEDKSVLDVGCGDLTFLNGKKFRDYLGLDISGTIIKRDRKKRPDLSLAVLDVTDPNIHTQQYDVVLCMDLLFHIMKEEDFGTLLGNLNRWAGEWLFLINWCKNPLPYRNDHYQYFRDLIPWLDRMPDLELIDTDQRKKDPYNMLYVFRRRKEREE